MEVTHKDWREWFQHILHVEFGKVDKVYVAHKNQTVHENV